MSWTKSNGTLAARVYERISKRVRRQWWRPRGSAHIYRRGVLDGINQTFEAIRAEASPATVTDLFERSRAR